ncbi:MAG: hypothetical protein KME28_23695 [Pelatocladus maniniholoensis HA4357-MV3]|jgi:hypothetical protein|uniref:Uncharacterized protein n=1 Tax=Pelatocladus maniniholoensis HA4357-MV3 TaxID=1117104 RepID=A0A9E3HCH4_9NOST|nr:hypothetical protein [Pelatocladus maniniholoensis HA4357-MV3]BAZ66917.1 hypothetical protein NIES4106_16700 [Fischerella sp. NIES-4106]
MISTLAHNVEKQLNFCGSHIDAKYVENVRDYEINKATIVVNPHMWDVSVGKPVRNIIPAFSSTILKDITIEKAEVLILIEVKDFTNIGNIILEEGWFLLGNTIEDTPSGGDTSELPYPKNTPLWKSPQDEAGIVEIDPYYMTRQANTPSEKQSFVVKLNLWFAPSYTNCFIHNKHDFIEIHTQIFGTGRMQKFKTQDYGTLYEDMLMSPGFTTCVPFCQVEENSKYIYPWHQYYADTDCIWIAIEYHPLAKA